MCYFLLVRLSPQLGLYLDSGDESHEFLEIESFVHLHISDNGRKSVPFSVSKLQLHKGFCIK